MEMQYFVACASVACQEACFSKKVLIFARICIVSHFIFVFLQERAEFYAQIPPMMHNFPHVWVVQNQMTMVNQRQQQMEQL